jgi:hypothetical protein
MHEIGRINGGRGFQTSGNVLQIGRNKFYDPKNEILMKILEFRRSRTGIIAEFCKIPLNSKWISQQRSFRRGQSKLPSKNDDF